MGIVKQWPEKKHWPWERKKRKERYYEESEKTKTWCDLYFLLIVFIKIWFWLFEEEKGSICNDQ